MPRLVLKSARATNPVFTPSIWVEDRRPFCFEILAGDVDDMVDAAVAGGDHFRQGDLVGFGVLVCLEKPRDGLDGAYPFSLNKSSVRCASK